MRIYPTNNTNIWEIVAASIVEPSPLSSPHPQRDMLDGGKITIKLEFVTPTAATRPVGDDFALVGGK